MKPTEFTAMITLYKNVLKTAVLTVSILSGSEAFAAMITIDDFTSNQPTAISSTGPNSTTLSALTNYWSKRTFTIDPLGGSGASVDVGNGNLTINTGPGSSAVSSVIWELNLSNLQAALTQATFFSISLEQVGLDIGNVKVSPGSVVRTAAHNGLTVELFTGNSVASITNPFTITFASSVAADSQWKNFAIKFTCVAGATTLTTANLANDGCAIPTPASAPLLGLGIIGLIALSRARKSANI
jgi:hypothetical protein